MERLALQELLNLGILERKIGFLHLFGPVLLGFLNPTDRSGGFVGINGRIEHREIRHDDHGNGDSPDGEYPLTAVGYGAGAHAPLLRLV